MPVASEQIEKKCKARGSVNGKFTYQRTMVVWMSYQEYKDIAKWHF